MKAARLLILVLMIGILALTLGVVFLVWDYPRGSGDGVVSPDGRYEAVVLRLTDRSPRQVLRYLLLPRVKSIPERRFLRIQVVEGRFGTDQDRILVSRDLPDRSLPAAEAGHWIHWQESPQGVLFKLTGTNILLHTETQSIPRPSSSSNGSHSP